MPANSISAKQLASAVDKAVKAAAERHKLQFEPQFTVNGIINGRMLREAANLQLPAIREAAAEIAQQASAAADAPGAALKLRLEPAVLVGRDYILCGFFPPQPVLINFE